MPLLPAENLIGGVSRQPVTIRLPNQLQESINMFPDVAKGLTKRPPATDLLLNEHMTAAGEDYTQMFEDADGTKYVMVIARGGLMEDVVRIWNLDLGAETEVIPSSTISTSYLWAGGVGNARDNIKTAISADTMMMVSTDRVVTSQSNDPFQDALPWDQLGVVALFVKVAQAKADYSASISWKNGSSPTTQTASVSITSPDATSSTRTPNNVAVQLMDAFIAEIPAAVRGEIKFKVKDGILLITNIQGGDSLPLTCEVLIDPIGNNKGIVAISHSVLEFTDLPAIWTNDANSINITGTEDNDYGDYFVKFEPSSAVPGELGDGKWVETYDTHTLKEHFENNSMPIKLIVDKTNWTVERGFGFLLEHPNYGLQLVGDSSTSPLPSFAGKKISNVFFYKNRMGFLADEALVLSELNEYFNFYPTTVLDVLDTDPIDIVADSGKVNILKNAVAYGGELIVSSKDTQFSLRSAGALTPNSASLIQIANYETDANISPTTTARSILYVSPDTADSSRILEFKQQEANIFIADDITLHIPKYISSSVAGIASHAASRTTVCWTNDSIEGSLYMNNTLWQNDTKVQNAWHKWELQTVDGHYKTILNCYFFDDVLHILLYDFGHDRTTVVSFDHRNELNEPFVDYQYALDFRTPSTNSFITTSTISSAGAADVTLIEGYEYGSFSRFPEVFSVNPDGTHKFYKVYLQIQGTITCEFIPDGVEYEIGLSPRFIWQPSLPILKNKEGKPILNRINNLSISSLNLYHEDTYQYSVATNSVGRDYMVDVMNADTTSISLLDRVPLDSAYWTTLIGGLYREVNINVDATNIYPASFINIEWDVETGSNR